MSQGSGKKSLLERLNTLSGVLALVLVIANFALDCSGDVDNRRRQNDVDLGSVRSSIHLDLYPWPQVMGSEQNARDALPILDRVLTNRPSDVQSAKATLYKGVCHFILRDWEEAEKLLAEASSSASTKHAAYSFLASLHEELGDMEEAEGYYETLIEEDQASVSPFVNLSRLLYQDRRAQEALRVVKEGLRRNSKHPKLRNNAGLIYARMGEQMDAERNFREAVRAAPEVAVYRAHLGWVLYGRGELQEAAEHLKRAVELDPGSYIRRHQLMEVYEAMGEHDRAAELRREVVLLAGEEPGED